MSLSGGTKALRSKATISLSFNIKFIKEEKTQGLIRSNSVIREGSGGKQDRNKKATHPLHPG